MCGANPMGGLLTSKTGRAAALGGVAGAVLAGGKKKSTFSDERGQWTIDERPTTGGRI